jgi:hypothetical protein
MKSISYFFIGALVLSAALAMAKTSIHEWDDPVPLFAPAGDAEAEPESASEPGAEAEDAVGEAVEPGDGEEVPLEEEEEMPPDEEADAALDEETDTASDEEGDAAPEDEEGDAAPEDEEEGALEEEPEAAVGEASVIALDEEPELPLAEGPASAMDRVRIEAGVRCLGVWLTDDRKGRPHNGSFIGSIYKLKARQNWLPIHPYVQATYELDSGWRLGGGLTYSYVETKTLDNGGGDGDIESNSIMAYLLAERDMGRFRPYAEAGGGVSLNEFDPHADWSANNTRKFDLDNSPAFFGGAGCAVGLVRGLALDAHIRYVHCDVDGSYIYKRDHRANKDFTFTTSYVAAGVGLSYAF